MTTWGDLPDELGRQQRLATRDLDRLFQVLWKDGPTDELVAELLRVARIGIFTAADTTARLQHQDLHPGVPHPQLLVDFAEQLAFTRSIFVKDRAVEVLSTATKAQVSPYARLAAQVLVTDAARKGTQAGGIVGDATHKQFVRIRDAREPRGHSHLEGSIRPVDGTWTIAGIEVDGPGDERLPPSEVFWCGHICRYLRLPAGSAPAEAEQERIKVGRHVTDVQGLNPGRIRDTVLRGAQLAGLDTYLATHPLTSVRAHPKLEDPGGYFTGDQYRGHIRLSLRRVEKEDYAVPFRWGEIHTVATAATSAVFSVQRTFVHELGHFVLQQLFDQQGRDVIEALIAPIYQAAVDRGECVSGRATVNWREYFCETLSASVYYPKELTARNPAGSKLVQDIKALLESP